MKRTLKNITIISVGASLILSCTNATNSSTPIPSNPKDTDSIIGIVDDGLDSSPLSWTEINFQNHSFIERMAYADTANFIGQKIYPCARCFLRPEAAEALASAQKNALQKGLILMLFDCYRPTKHQQVMFDLVQDPKYVAEPKQGGSMHNKGLAVDIALADSLGNMLDFGGEFDDFSEKSHHSYRNLSSMARANRVLLNGIMTEAGFSPYQYEWWHYSYEHVNYDLDDFIWSCN